MPLLTQHVARSSGHLLTFPCTAHIIQQIPDIKCWPQGSHHCLYGGNALRFLVAEGCGGGQKVLVGGKSVCRCTDGAFTSTGQDAASSTDSHPPAGSRELENSPCPDLTLKIRYWPGQEQDAGVDLALVQPQMTLGSLSSYHGAAGGTCLFIAYVVGVVSKMRAKAGEQTESPWPRVTKGSADPLVPQERLTTVALAIQGATSCSS